MHSQDVQIIGGEEKDGWTRIEFTRLVDTGQEKDRAIGSTDRVLWVRFGEGLIAVK